NGDHFLRPAEFTTGPRENENVEATVNTVLVISTKAGDKLPSQIVAVLNDETFYSDTHTITDLQNVLTEGRNKIEGKDYFVMTNSVYSKDGVKQIGVSVEGYLYPTAAAAQANPVTIYVERALAKVTVESGITTSKTLEDGTVIYQTTKKDATTNTDITTQFNGKDVYVKFLGWNVTARRTEDRLVKEINTAWVPGWTWNTADYHRSFWAINAPVTEGVEPYEWGTFNKAGDKYPALKYTDFTGENEWAYVKENAGINEEGNDPTTPTQVIIAAQLCDEDGNEMEFAEWAAVTMSFDDLRAAYANAAPLYYANGTDADGNTVFTKIGADDIKLATATELGLASPTVDGRYKVYPTLSATGAAKTWYNRPNSKDAPALTAEEVQATLTGLGGAKAWKGGMTYYYFDINHLGHGINGAAFGDKGVVRNHIYAATVTSLSGLGTPVYNPDEIIYPEKPEDEYLYIAANIKILSWRVVRFNTSLDW
ncbi:MAG: fimbria major subunit, partial [Muribaculaceae bacterium]|nr:fimbria major subunit [Muribaculaceae bacterium]